MEERMPDGILEKSMRKLDEEIADIVSKGIKGSHDLCMKAVTGMDEKILENTKKTELCSTHVSKANDKMSNIADAISHLEKASSQHSESNIKCMDAIRLANERIVANTATCASTVSTLVSIEKRVKNLFLNNANLEPVLKSIHDKQGGLKRWIVGIAFLVVVETATLCYLLFDKY